MDMESINDTAYLDADVSPLEAATQARSLASQNIQEEAPEAQESPEEQSEVQEQSKEEAPVPEFKKHLENQRIPKQRFDEVNNKYKEAEARARALEEELARYRQPKESPKTEKTIDDYEDPKDYITDTAIEAARKAAIEAAAEERAKIQSHQQLEQVTNTFRSAVDEYAKVLPDVKEAVGYLVNLSNEGQIAPHVEEMILTSHPHIAYAIASDPQLLNFLNHSNPIIAARQIGMMEASIKKPASTATTAPQKHVPRTPNGQFKTEKPVSKMSFDEFCAYKENQEKRKY